MPSFLSSRLRKTLAWLALCAMCFGTAAPTVSRWLAAAAQDANQVVLCTRHGLMLVTAASLQTPAQDHQQDRHHGSPPGDDEACGYCTLTHHWPWAPVATVAFAPHALPPSAQRVPADVSAPALRPWRRPHMPQAPPLPA